MANLSYVNVFVRDLQALPDFYRDVFGFTEIDAIRSPIFRALDTGKSNIGFNAHDAYKMLLLDEYSDTKGVKFMLNFEVDSAGEVDRLIPVAVSKGATLVQAAHKTYYNWYQAVFFDPEGNVFRINHTLS